MPVVALVAAACSSRLCLIATWTSSADVEHVARGSVQRDPNKVRCGRCSLVSSLLLASAACLCSWLWLISIHSHIVDSAYLVANNSACTEIVMHDALVSRLAT